MQLSVCGIDALVGSIIDKPIRYQLIFQFSETFFMTHNDLVAFEDKWITSMPKTYDVDGHDVGSGTTHFFVYTDKPLAAFKHPREYMGTNKVERNRQVRRLPNESGPRRRHRTA